MSATLLNTNAKAHQTVTEELVKKALLSDKGPEAKYKAFEIIDFCSKGDNYACFVTSVKVIFLLGGEEKTETYITKINHGNEQGDFEQFSAVMFRKEGKFYTSLVPAMNEELQNLGLSALKFASCYLVSSEPRKEILFFEDKRKMAFKMADRMVGLDDLHVISVVTELARLHASSTLVKENLGEEKFCEKYDFLGDFFTEDITNTKDGSFADAFSGYLETGSKIAGKVAGYEQVSAALAAMAPTCFETLKKVTTESDPKFRVVNHGDCWNNNLLFRYEDGQVVDVCLLDLQICRHASLALDLNYFFFTSLNGDTRKKGLKSYLAAYYNAFKEVYDAAKKPMQFTLDELHKEYINKLKFGLFMSLMVTPIVVMQAVDAPDFTEMSDDSLEEKMAKFRELVLSMIETSPILRPRVLDMFDEMVEHGVFEIP
ncbi:Protein of unknown function DUF227 [Trinorchestia longiramus]|nr:Protein of unknown function DUF227 [Trinorchestia longiramus]